MLSNLRIKKNIQPYLGLIGFGDLEPILGHCKFVVLSELCDNLDQLIDQTESTELDILVANYIFISYTGYDVSYNHFYTGLETLTKLKNIPEEIKQQAQFIVSQLPKPNI
jgi:hypothetical protein